MLFSLGVLTGFMILSGLIPGYYLEILPWTVTESDREFCVF
jgi:hypothetical protein